MAPELQEPNGVVKSAPAAVNGHAAGGAAAAVWAAALAAAAAASTGELLTTAFFYPFELVKCRLQAAERGDRGSFAYTGLAHGLRCLVREEGLLGLLAGLPSAAVRSVALDFATVCFGELLLGRRRVAAGRPDALTAVLLRTVGGCGGILLTAPLETVATRVMTARPPLGAGAAVQQLWREGGPASFWRGLLVSFLLCLNPALMLTAVDGLRAAVLALPRRRGRGPGAEAQMSWAEALLVGALAKLATMSLVYPLVRGKVLMQARHQGGAGMLQVLGRAVRSEGLAALYRGLGAQLSKSLLSASLKYAVKERTEGRWRRLLGAEQACAQASPEAPPEVRPFVR